MYVIKGGRKYKSFSSLTLESDADTSPAATLLSYVIGEVIPSILLYQTMLVLKYFVHLAGFI